MKNSLYWITRYTYSRFAFNSKIIGSSSRLFGLGGSGILNQGVIRFGWGHHESNYVFRGIIGHNPIWAFRHQVSQTTFFGYPIHYHTPSLFEVPKP